MFHTLFLQLSETLKQVQHLNQVGLSLSHVDVAYVDVAILAIIIIIIIGLTWHLLDALPIAIIILAETKFAS